MHDAVMAPELVLPAPPLPTVAVAGTAARFPVRRIFCVGRNYAAHAREMGRDPDREPPFFFLKPADAVVDNGATVPYPPETANFHYEIELVVAIAKGGFNIPAEQALDHVFGYAVGIDLTRRDLQFAARELGRPWDWGKGFDRSAPVAPHPPRLRGRPPGIGPHLARGGRPGEAGLRHRQADLAGARRHRHRVPLDGAAARRPDHDRHPRGRRPGPPRPDHDRRHRWARGDHRARGRGARAVGDL